MDMQPSGSEQMDNYQSQRKRAFRTRSRTGCNTCRIRRIRCDEQKPSCLRCASTGRKCDGYGNDTGQPAQPHIDDTATNPDAVSLVPRGLQVPLPRNDRRELRSYHFFLSIAASSLAGVFDADFWLVQLPQMCHLDPAIWHAVVSLGAVHELTTSPNVALLEGPSSDTNTTSMFATQQFNAAVRHLVHLPSTRTTLEEKWRALVASVLFTYVCSIRGLHGQADVHLSAAKNLFKELQKEDNGRSHAGQLALTKPTDSSNMTSLSSKQPVSYQNLLSVVASLENDSQALHNIGVNIAPEFFGDIDPYVAWRYYSAPSPGTRPCQHGRCIPSRATAANLAHAGRAFQSLLNALITLSQQSAPEKSRLVLEGKRTALDTLIERQKPCARAFWQLDVATEMFIADATNSPCQCFGPARSPPIPSPSVTKAIIALRLFRAICYPVLYDKSPPITTTVGPTGDSNAECYASASCSSFTELVDHALDIAEEILQAESYSSTSISSHEMPSSDHPFIPTLSPLHPLFIIAHSGATFAQRRKAVALLREHPVRREGLGNPLLMAAMGDAVIAREESLANMDRDKGEEPEEVSASAVPAAYKVRWAAVTFTGPRGARLRMQTFVEWVAKRNGTEVDMLW